MENVAGNKSLIQILRIQNVSYTEEFYILCFLLNE
jgi:hypothetical protein